MHVDRYASSEKGATLLLLSGGTGPDVMAHDVTDPADVQTLGTLNGHKLAVSNGTLLHSWIILLGVKISCRQFVSRRCTTHARTVFQQT